MPLNVPFLIYDFSAVACTRFKRVPAGCDRCVRVGARKPSFCCALPHPEAGAGLCFVPPCPRHACSGTWDRCAPWRRTSFLHCAFEIRPGCTFSLLASLCRAVFHSDTVSRFFIGGPGLFPVFDHYEQSCCERSCAGHCAALPSGFLGR